MKHPELTRQSVDLEAAIPLDLLTDRDARLADSRPCEVMDIDDAEREDARRKRLEDFSRLLISLHAVSRDRLTLECVAYVFQLPTFGRLTERGIAERNSCCEKKVRRRLVTVRAAFGF